MAKYRKKPVVIEATRWFRNGDHPEDNPGRVKDVGVDVCEGKIVRYFRHPKMSGTSLCAQCDFMLHLHGWIDTLEGGHQVCPGDWIIKGVAGEFYPCKPNIFATTYDPVADK